jgi:thiol-disulfide isomerase/thioredoxin
MRRKALKKYLFLLVLGGFLFFASPVFSKSIDFSFKSYQGKVYRLSDFRGKYVLLNLFATYCPPCLGELQVLEKVSKRCGSKVKVISLLLDWQSAPLLSQLINTGRVNYLIGLANDQVLNAFPDFDTTPTTYLLNKKGERVEKIVGFTSYQDWIRLLQKYTSCN